MDDRKAFLLLAAVIGLVLSLSYLMWSGPLYWFDDINYITYAHQMLTGTFSVVQSPYAYGFLPSAAIALSFLLLGASPFSAVLPNLIECIAMVVLTFLIGRKLYGNDVAVLSAFLCATAPFVIGYTSRALPDMLLGTIAALSIYVFLIAQERGEKHSHYLYAAAGAIAGLTIFVKLLGLAFMLAFFVGTAALYLMGKGRRMRNGVAMAIGGNEVISVVAGLMIVFIAYDLMFFVYTGSPFYGVITYGQNQAAISHSSISQNISVLLVMFFGYSATYTSIFGEDVSWNIFPLGLIAFWAVAGGVIAMASRKREGVFLAALTWVLPLYLFFGTVSLSSYTSIFVTSRYFIAVAAPMAVLASYAMLDMSRAFGVVFGETVRTAMLAAFIAATIISYMVVYIVLYNYSIAVSENNYALGSAVAYLNDTHYDGQLLVNDYGYVTYLDFLSGYRRQINAVPLNFSHMNDLKLQISGACDSTSPTYVFFAFDNYTETQSLINFNIVKSFITADCMMKSVASFNEQGAQQYAFNAFDLNATMYEINRT